MFNYSPASFSDTGSCSKCSLFVVLEVRLSGLKAQLQTMESSAATVDSQAPIAGVHGHSVAPASCPLAAPEQPGGWVTVRRKHSPKTKPTMAHYQPIRISNRFSSLKLCRNKLWSLAAP